MLSGFLKPHIVFQNEARKETGYDDHPTVDTHLFQVGLQDQWIVFLRTYVAPLAHKVWEGYLEV